LIDLLSFPTRRSSDLQIGLKWALFGKCSAIYMINLNRSIIKDCFFDMSQPPAEVYFLHMRKKAFVKSTESMKICSSNKQTSPRCPVDFYTIIILMQVLFGVVKNSAPTIGIAELV